MDFSIVWMPNIQSCWAAIQYHKEECEQRTATNADSSVVNCAVLTNAEVSKGLNAVNNFRHVYAYVNHGNPYGRWPWWLALWTWQCLLNLRFRLTLLKKKWKVPVGVDAKLFRHFRPSSKTLKHRQWHPSDHPSGFGMTNIDRSHIWSPIGLLGKGILCTALEDVVVYGIKTPISNACFLCCCQSQSLECRHNCPQEILTVQCFVWLENRAFKMSTICLCKASHCVWMSLNMSFLEDVSETKQERLRNGRCYPGRIVLWRWIVWYYQILQGASWNQCSYSKVEHLLFCTCTFLCLQSCWVSRNMLQVLRQLQGWCWD